MHILVVSSVDIKVKKVFTFILCFIRKVVVLLRFNKIQSYE